MDLADTLVAVDFDGTLVDHRFPEIGPPVPHAFESIKLLQARGVKFMLWTMRSDGRADGTTPLSDAVQFCEEHGVKFWGVNENPEQRSWTGSPKQYAHIYVDDAALGCPMIRVPGFKGPVVDWAQVCHRLLVFAEERRRNLRGE